MHCPLFKSVLSHVQCHKCREKACTLKFIDDDYFWGEIYYQYIYKFALKVQQLLGRNDASNESLITWL